MGMFRRDHRGQGSMELVGMVAVAGVLVSAVVTAVATQSPAVSTKICEGIHQITQESGGCSGSDTPVADDDEGDDDTPVTSPLPERTPVCKPADTGNADSDGFPEGSVSVKDEKGPKNGLTSTTETSVKTGPVTVDDQGNEWQTSTVTADTKVTAKGKEKLRGIDLSASVGAGTSVSYAITVPPSATGDIEAGLPPTPFDPSSIPTGGNVTLTQKTYASLGLDASYKGLRAGVSTSGGVETSTAVVKLPNGNVRVMVGPADVLENGLKLGVGTSDFNINAYVDDKYTDYKLQQAEFDLSTPAGEDAYYAMVLGGKPPTTDGGGVSNVSTVEGSKYSHRAGISAQIKKLSGKLPGNGRDTDVSVTEYADGRVTYTATGTEGGMTITSSETVDANGKLVKDGGKYTIRFKDVDAAMVDKFNEYYGQERTDVGDDQNVVMDFTAEDIARMKDDAYVIIADSIKNDSNWRDYFGHEPTPKDVKKFLDEHGGTDIGDSIAGSPNTQSYSALQVIQAENNFDSLLQIMRGEVFSPSVDNSLTWLINWQEALERADSSYEDSAGPGNTLCRASG
jgi:hypothetical protein